MVLAPADAERILVEHSPEQEAWPHHCRQVAKVARLIGEALLDQGHSLDVELLTSQALLHDIGRAKTHGPLHGWTGFVMLRDLGFPKSGRGCLTHWLKGRAVDEVRAAKAWKPSLADRAFKALEPTLWELADSVLSFADSSVQHTTIVPVTQRHQDLLDRYGDSSWLRRAAELGEDHGAEITAALGFPVEHLLTPLFGDSVDGH
ncbi:MAG: HDIG domain-containing protein [Planctomycetes bacterium]|nr:HDIG domain-containing protein [Planctomycetota bacterium]MCP4770887.1 HDIG domain-containing protein [Planctomycetota bacterium]MCP4862288.1 HDIG domain-containing protein [Planctomycetota bacterium]